MVSVATSGQVASPTRTPMRRTQATTRIGVITRRAKAPAADVASTIQPANDSLQSHSPAPVLPQGPLGKGQLSARAPACAPEQLQQVPGHPQLGSEPIQARARRASRSPVAQQPLLALHATECSGNIAHEPCPRCPTHPGSKASSTPPHVPLPLPRSCLPHPALSTYSFRAEQGRCCPILERQPEPWPG